VIKQHILSVIGQAAAALPPVLVLIFLSRKVGLELAGLFTIVAGISAAAFSTAHWGLRTSVLLDRFRTIDVRTYLIARLFALTLAAVVVAVVSGFLDIDYRLIAGLILFKVSDGLLDLDFAVTQVRSETSDAIAAFAFWHAIKLLLLISALAIAVYSGQGSIQTAFVLAGLVALMLVSHRIYRTVAVKQESRSTTRAVWQVFVNAAWFAIAAGLCAIVTSAPRFSLAWLYEGDVLGVIGVTLSASTFFGMVFYTTWTRHLPKFGGPSSFRLTAMRFLAESFLIGAAIFVVSWVLLPQIVGFVFAYSEPQQLLLTKQVLVASVVFFVGMNTCNLYKVTARPWMESVSYALALAVPVMLALVNPEMRETHLLLATSGLVMLVCGLAALGAPMLVTSDRPEP